jgi:PAS domain-containing protein
MPALNRHSGELLVPEERRRRARPDTVVGYLDEVPARVLLDRLPIPAIAVGDDGVIAFANPACETMLGQLEIRLVGRPLTEFLRIRPTTAPEAVGDLRNAAGTTTVWAHPTNGIVKVIASQPLLLRADDPVTLVTLTDVTDWLWTTETAHVDALEL